MSEINTQALANLDAESRKEIMQWVESENSKSKVQMCKNDVPSCHQTKLCSNLLPLAIHNFTDMCFKKCITGKITSSTLDRNEESCTMLDFPGRLLV